MMKVGTLLDTHAWIWLVFNERRRANARAWKDIDDASLTNSLAVSEISFWEIATKAAKGKLELDRDVVVWLREAASTPGVGIVEVEREVLVKSALLEVATRDPADRILAATALRYGLRLATADTALLKYAQRNRMLKVLDMRPEV
ncbi:MAG: type II toxin-antitoxin system VapC family toxin [Gemmatimonadota bacterium]